MIQVSLLATLALVAPAAAAEPSADPVALVSLLEGEATVTAGGATRPAVLFGRLASGAVLEAGSSSVLVLAFANGRRFRLEEKGRARVADESLEALDGDVTELERVPELVDLPPLMVPDTPQRAAATRVRSGGLGRRDDLGLAPGRGAVVLAGGAVLRFTALSGAERYRVVLEDDMGRELLAVETETSQISVPDGILSPASSYYWRVTTLDGRRPAARADAVFTTLGEKEAEARDALARRAEADEDGALRLLQLEVDRRLGLQEQACEGLVALGSELDAVRSQEWTAELGCP